MPNKSRKEEEFIRRSKEEHAARKEPTGTTAVGRVGVGKYDSSPALVKSCKSSFVIKLWTRLSYQKKLIGIPHRKLWKARHIEFPDWDIRSRPDCSIINRPVVISYPHGPVILLWTHDIITTWFNVISHPHWNSCIKKEHHLKSAIAIYIRTHGTIAIRCNTTSHLWHRKFFKAIVTLKPQLRYKYVDLLHHYNMP